MASAFATMFKGAMVAFNDIDEGYVRYGNFISYDKSMGRVRLALMNPEPNEAKIVSIRESLAFEATLGPAANPKPAKPAPKPKNWRRMAALKAWETMRARKMQTAMAAA